MKTETPKSYLRIDIHGPEDLPKEAGYYIASCKNYAVLEYYYDPLDIYDWMHEIDWYLIEQPEQPESLKDELIKAQAELIEILKDLRECLLSKININKLSDSQCRGIDSYNNAAYRIDEQIQSLTSQIEENHLPDAGKMVEQPTIRENGRVDAETIRHKLITKSFEYEDEAGIKKLPTVFLHDAIEILNEFASLKAQEGQSETVSVSINKISDVAFYRLNILKYLNKEQMIILRDWLNNYDESLQSEGQKPSDEVYPGDFINYLLSSESPYGFAYGEEKPLVTINMDYTIKEAFKIWKNQRK